MLGVNSVARVSFSLYKPTIVVVEQVSQLAGYVSEHSAYHHGDVSLTSTIVGMAQNFVGSNNVNLLYPSGLLLYYQMLVSPPHCCLLVQTFKHTAGAA